ncbi:MAG: PDZ domain-containing protein [Pyrinomonadaceae bacterium]
MSKFDAFDTDDGDVTALLRALPRVEASTNFEFGVKARIAKGDSRRWTFIPFLKVAAPLSLVFAVAGFGIFYGTLPAENGNQVAEAPVKVEPPVVTARNETEIAAPKAMPDTTSVVLPAVPERASIAPRKPRVIQREASSRAIDRSGGGSLDSSLGSANTILPPGFESANPRGTNLNTNLNANVGATQIPLRDVFGMMGISAEFVNGGWTVRSAVETSTSARAGLQAGDVIESVNGQQLIQTTVFKGEFSGRSLRVRRDGKTIDLNLR